MFLFDEPTRGIDVGAKVEVFRSDGFAGALGAAILMVSSEMSELLQVADRILVMRQGRITGELPGRTTQPDRSCGMLLSIPASPSRGAPGMIQRLLPFFTLIALFIILAIASPNFLTATNLSSVVRQTAVINIMALGMTLIIISGGIDLSVGSILALAGLLGTRAMERKMGIPAGMVIGLLIGTACGFANGTMVTLLRINPFIVTLGTMGIFRGLASDHFQRSACA